MITIFSAFPADQRGRAMGIYGLGVVLAPALGPAVGGALSSSSAGRRCSSCRALLRSGFDVGTAVHRRPHRVGGASSTLRLGWPGVHHAVHRLPPVRVERKPSRRLVFRVDAWNAGGGAGRAVPSCGGSTGEARHARPRRIRKPAVRRGLGRGSSLWSGLDGTTVSVAAPAQTVAQYSPAKAGALLSPAGIALAVTLPIAGL